MQAWAAYFNPRFPRGKRPGIRGNLWTAMISIHASRGGSDLRRPDRRFSLMHFNPRFPRGKRPISTMWRMLTRRFQSTLPAGEATTMDWIDWIRLRDFNPRFPRGKRRRCFHAFSPPTFNFNPRFPRGKRPSIFNKLYNRDSNFNPRFPRGKRQLQVGCKEEAMIISIHASRGGSDAGEAFRSDAGNNFNPRFPRGKRQTAKN